MTVDGQTIDVYIAAVMGNGDGTGGAGIGNTIVECLKTYSLKGSKVNSNHLPKGSI